MRQCLAILAFLLFPAHLAGAIAAEPAQAHIAFLGTLPRSNPNEARALGWFTDRLREHGWVEGQNLTLTYRASEGVNERYAELAAELIAKHPDVIVAEGPEAVQAIEQRTKTIPIVMWGVPDPVGLGLVASLGRPGANITGLSMGTEDVLGKGMQFLTEVRPGVLRIVYLGYGEPRYWKLTEENSTAAAQRLGVALQMIPLTSPADFDAAFATLAKQPPDALIVSSAPIFFAHTEKFADFASVHHLPTLTFAPVMVRRGLLMAYHANSGNLFERLAAIVDKSLRGTRPADIPIEQPTKFDLVLNLKTAKAIGLTIPSAILARVDEVID
jgi:putative ABC transport system substrate-binding protein